MNIYISKQNIEVGFFKTWLLRLAGVGYSLKEKEPETKESKVEEFEEKTQNLKTDNVMMRDVASGLSNRAYNTVWAVLREEHMIITRISVKEFVEKFTVLDLAKVRGCGKATIREIRSAVELLGYTMREQ